MKPAKNPYRQLFTIPGAVAFSAAGFVARMAHLMSTLSIVFLVSARTGSYARAGVVAAAYALTYSLASPLVSRIVDRRRQGEVLWPAAVANTLSRAGFLAAVWLHAPIGVVIAAAALSGASMPPIGPLVRARWGYLLRGTPAVHTALSFESVMDQVINTTGPIIVSMLAVYLNPAGGVVVTLLFATAGLVALAPQRATEPAVRQADGVKGGTALTVPGFPLLIVTFIAMGAAGNTISIVTVAFCQNHGEGAASGWILSLLALGSGISGFWYGLLKWSTPPERRLVLSLALLTIGTLLFVGAPEVWLLLGAAFGYGLTSSPTMIAGFSVVNRFVPERLLTEGLTWVTASVGLGISLGSTVAGTVIDKWGTTWAYALATGWAVVAVAASALLLAVLRRSAGPVVSEESAEAVESAPANQ